MVLAKGGFGGFGCSPQARDLEVSSRLGLAREGDLHLGASSILAYAAISTFRHQGAKISDFGCSLQRGDLEVSSRLGLAREGVRHLGAWSKPSWSME